MALLELVNNDPSFFYYSGLGNFTQRSISYGNDQPNGGNSGEPYIVTPIPPVFQQQSQSDSIWLSDNGLIRGGFAGATKASVQDTIRIGKFLKDPPRGPLFIAKQIGLQLSNPKQEVSSNLLSRIANAVGSTRIYNLGINTLAQIPVAAFGGHIIRHGFTPILNVGQTYSKVVVSNDAAGTFGVNNRLVQLKDKLVTYPNSNIASYVSGPGSVDGIGTTTINRVVNTLSNPQYNQYGNLTTLGFDPITGLPEAARITPLSNISLLYPGKQPTIDYFRAQGVSEQYFATEDGNPSLSEIDTYNNILTGSFNSKPSQIDQNIFTELYPASGRTYRVLKTAIANQNTNRSVGTSTVVKNAVGRVLNPISFTYTGKAYSGKNKNLTLGGPQGYNIEQRLGLSGQNQSDQINLTPLYINSSPPGTTVYINGAKLTVRDLIKFRIEAVEGDNPNLSTWMIFRAYLKDITDSPNPTWSTVNYVGRGEPFYIYKGFERTLSFTFQVAAMSEDELKPMWQKLNYLYSNTMPDYSGNVMRGPFMKLTIGNYMYRQPGIIKSLTYTIDNKSPWEIAITDPEQKGNLYELPHVMNVSMTFAPIHDFLPRKFPSKKPESNTFLPAFVVDRQTDDNKWLNSIYNGNGGKEILNANTSIPQAPRDGLFDDNITPPNVPYPAPRDGLFDDNITPPEFFVEPASRDNLFSPIEEPAVIRPFVGPLP
jgi:hypothetical protein